MAEKNPALAGLPEPGEPVFYPKVGHCIYRRVTEDSVAPGTELLELEDMEEGSRILIPLARGALYRHDRQSALAASNSGFGREGRNGRWRG